MIQSENRNYYYKEEKNYNIKCDDKILLILKRLNLVGLYFWNGGILPKAFPGPRYSVEGRTRDPLN
jgi:hypothetical protein